MTTSFINKISFLVPKLLRPIPNVKLHFGFCSGIVNTGDRVAEPSCSGIERRGADVNENQFRLTIDGIVALGTLGLAAFYLSSPENKAKVVALCLMPWSEWATK